MGVLNRGEDTDGERTDDELDHPSQSFVSEHEDEGTHVCQYLPCLLYEPSPDPRT